MEGIIGPRIVRCEEWGRINIGDAGEYLNSAEVEEIIEAWRNQSGREAEGYFDVTRKYLAPKNWVGVVTGRTIQFEVQPMGSRGLTDNERLLLDRNFSAMLRAAVGDVSIHLDSSELSPQGNAFEGLIAALCSVLKRARRSQLIRRYTSNEEVSRFLRGKVAFPKQIFESVRSPGYFACRWVELNEDVPENRFLKSVLRLFQGRCSGSLRRQIDELLAQLGGVRESSYPMTDYRRVRFDRLSYEYRQAIFLAKCLLDGRVPGIFSGAVQGRSRVVFTPTLFELFVHAILKDAAERIGYSVRRQPRGHFMGNWSGGPYSGRSVFEVIPDFEMKRNEDKTFCIVIDTKWKRLRPERANLGISIDDLYQVMSYAYRFNSSRIAILYPWIGSGWPSDELTTDLILSGNKNINRITISRLPMPWKSKTELQSNAILLLTGIVG